MNRVATRRKVYRERNSTNDDSSPEIRFYKDEPANDTKKRKKNQ